VVHLWWDGAGYTNFEPLLDLVSASDPFGWMRADGHPEVFAVDKEGALAKTYRGDAGWTPWSWLGGDNLNPCVPGSGNGEGGGGEGGAGGTGVGVGGVGAAPGGTGDEAGCACRAAAHEEMPAGWIAAAAIAPLALMRRRRRSRGA
jgi:hypothetical protein